jgi:hypothetical protein
MSPQDKVWESVDLRNFILKKLFEGINKYYINICECYKKLIIK